MLSLEVSVVRNVHYVRIVQLTGRREFIQNSLDHIVNASKGFRSFSKTGRDRIYPRLIEKRYIVLHELRFIGEIRFVETWWVGERQTRIISIPAWWRNRITIISRNPSAASDVWSNSGNFKEEWL